MDTTAIRGARLRRLALASLACLLFTLAACSSAASSSAASPAASGASASSPAASGGDTIVIKNFMFSPMSLTVAPGATLTVRNEDTTAHTLTDKADPKLFGTGNIGAGQTKTFHAPKQAGSYPFICLIHQYMSGTLVVR